MQLVESFREALAEAIGPPPWGATLSEMLGSREGGRDGRTQAGAAYRIHGAGCRFELADGREVDVDLSQSREVLVDAWRIRSFAASAGTAISEGEAEVALAEAKELVEKRSGGWYALVE